MTFPSSSSRVHRALVPAAGFGTRMRPLTLAIPKEMLPIGRKHVLDYVVEELKLASIDHVLFVVSPGKEMIRKYFGDGERFGLHIDYVLQPEMRGLGDAILCGEEWTQDEPFVVAFGDCIIESPAEVNPLCRMLDVHTKGSACATVLTERIPREKTRKYGILQPSENLAEPISLPFQFADIVEKPLPENAPGERAVAARWVLETQIFRYLHKCIPDPNGEVNLTDAVRAMLREDPRGWAVPLLDGEVRLDIGGWDTYFIAQIRAALADPEMGDIVHTALFPD